ncbi:MAG: L-seryl-tRNA(Sec) selenium transferase, partial [Gemmatimonadetes bacterium]|nr:L-seryl-tRNA(Sec) selenium transferase [Gemmatimonadota bacterium]
MTEDPRRRIPSVDALLQSLPLAPVQAEFGRGRVVEALRRVGDAVRAGVGGPAASGAAVEDAAWWAAQALEHLRAADVPSLRGVINATGVVLHTNLGRAPLAAAARQAMALAATGYGNLEMDLESGKRGSRYRHCTGLLAELSGAPAALVVSNAAAALLLALSTVARGRGVAVSRGELAEIGGGFRSPEVLERSGARMVE